MKIFISWSGVRSRQVALLLEEWIKVVIQASQPWMSTSIDRGALWFSELNEQLASVSLGIICLTDENKDKPWILFEAGALAKGLNTTRVCTFLIDLKNEDIGQPLAQFNHTEPTKEGVFQLMNTINAQLEDKRLPQHILEKAFDKNWSEFEERFDMVTKQLTVAPQKKSKRDSDEILTELLNTVRSFDQRIQSIETKNHDRKNKILEVTTDHGKQVHFFIEHPDDILTWILKLKSNGVSNKDNLIKYTTMAYPMFPHSAIVSIVESLAKGGKQKSKDINQQEAN